MCPIYGFGDSIICYNNGERTTTKCKIKVHALQNFNPSNIIKIPSIELQKLNILMHAVFVLLTANQVFFSLFKLQEKNSIQLKKVSDLNSIEKGIT